MPEPSFEGTLDSEVHEAEAFARDEQGEEEVPEMILREGFKV